MKLLRQGFIVCFLPALALCGIIANVVDQGHTLSTVVLRTHHRALANEKPRFPVIAARMPAEGLRYFKSQTHSPGQSADYSNG